ncbi:hypothetical protein [Leptolyngbya ohadii]|uniref:hypothetical protein n=1 Tax=Leptolyngbya ohadii TaxID=1962290 RepID=UPI000B599B35|nr:hypothetical protein [Leptolyngbya ohadii]
MTQEHSQSETRSRQQSNTQGQQDVDASYQPEQGSPDDVQGDAALRSSSPLNDRMNEKSEEALEEA